MPLITNATEAWADAVTLTRDEFWQAREGAFALSTEADPAAGAGIMIPAPYGIQLSTGVAVRYRKLTGSPCVISREATSL